ncbi:DUF2959 domain-containing protein [Halioxenophilus sp. WMMB6]|uniref:DUF2959 domain-containing protein n=1 Tax=Halioxenophilus sp. WMMB6 TaxID=3073815 RepID=UPI00295ECDD9|nr:DUF2959 domain-containing protein [Halioxenophilus sp. WMMB6]
MTLVARLTLTLALVTLTGCQSAYYAAWEKLGVEKRDLLIDQVEDAQEAQEDGKVQFTNALEQFRLVAAFDGGDLEAYYEELRGELEASQSAANKISSRIDDVETVAEDLFAEWREELKLYNSENLRRDSAAKLADTQKRYQRLITAMHKAEASTAPVLTALSDNVLYLKHNLNARAISSLQGELNTVNSDVQRLLTNMQAAIDQSNAFIAELNR